MTDESVTPDLIAESAKLWDAKAQFWDELMGDEGNRFYRELVGPSQMALLDLSPADSTVLATMVTLVRSGRCAAFMSRDKTAFGAPDTAKFMEAEGITYYDSALPIVGPRRADP